MIYEKAREEMTPRDVTNMEEILSKDNNSILPAERELLVARRSYLTDEELEKFGIEGGAKKKSSVGGAYAEMKFADLKKEAKDRGIITTNKDKAVDLIALLEQYDGLQDGDEFQGKIAHIATQAMIDDNELASELAVGDLFFASKEEDEEEDEGE